MKWIIKFFKWLEDIFGDGVYEIPFSEGGASSHREWQEVDRLLEKQKAEKIFAEIDNDLIRQIDKAVRDFKQAQLKHIPCQILYYSKFEIKSTIDMTRLFLIKRNRIIRGGSVTLENGEVVEAGSWHENTKYIKYKDNNIND